MTKIMVYEIPVNVLGHGGSLRKLILNMCPQLDYMDVIVGYFGPTDPSFPEWAISFTEAGYDYPEDFCAGEGIDIMNISYGTAPSSQFDSFEAVGVPVVSVCTSDVAHSPGWALYVGRDYLDMSVVSASSNGIDFKVRANISLSAATATVTGHIANLLHNHPTWSFGDARQALRQTADNYATGWTRVKGYGYIDYNTANVFPYSELVVGPSSGMRAVVHKVGPSVDITWTNPFMTRFASTKLVLFSSAPTSETLITEGTELYDGPGSTYVWNTASAVPATVGTHYLNVYSVDVDSNISALDLSVPITVEIIATQTWFVDNEAVTAVRNGKGWETPFASMEEAALSFADDDTVYIKATDTPYYRAFSTSFRLTVYGDATGVGTERGKKRCVSLPLAGKVKLSTLAVSTDFPTLLLLPSTSITLLGLYDENGFVRLLDYVNTMAECLSTPGTWHYDTLGTRKLLLNPEGIGREYYIVMNEYNPTSHTGVLAGIDFMFSAPYHILTGGDALVEDCSVKYSVAGCRSLMKYSAVNKVWRRVKSIDNTGYGFSFISEANGAGRKIIAEYCLSENNLPLNKYNSSLLVMSGGFAIIDKETVVDPTNEITLLNCTAKGNAGEGFRQSGTGIGNANIHNCHSYGNGGADFDKVPGTSTITCSNNRAGGATPYAGDWGANKGAGSEESNDIELVASPIDGIHNQESPAKDVNGKLVYTLPDIGAEQVSGPLYFNASAADGGNGTKAKPFNVLPDFTGYYLRAGAEIRLQGALGALDLSRLTDTGAKSIKVWPDKKGSIAGFTSGPNDVLEMGGATTNNRGVFSSPWE